MLHENRNPTATGTWMTVETGKAMSEKGESSEIEFRSCDDDAWYNVQVMVEEGDSFGRLRVKFCGLKDQVDYLFHSKDFSSLKELDDFSARFRALSLQLQDAECYKISKGLTVCASHHFKKDDLRFFDAVVEGVDHQEHSFETGEEECLCTFILSWLHGPLAGRMTAENIESICRLQFNVEKDPAVASFLKTVREKIEITGDSNSLSKGEVTSISTANHHGEIPGLNVGHKRIFSQHLKQDTRRARQSSNGMTDYPSEISGQDKDIGGAGNYYLIFVENLEKDLSPVSIMEFVHEEVSIPCQAIVCRSLSSELCTRGNILLDSKKNFEKLCDFLENPDRIIVSSRGRPWLITEKISVHDAMRASIGPLVHRSQKFLRTGNTKTTNELKIVYLGTKEYRMASELRENFAAFSNHQKVLHKRLSFEEDKVMQRYNAKHIV